MIGDLGVYKHDDAQSKADVDKNYSSKNTSAGGTKMGETLHSLSFADFDIYHSTGRVVVAKGAEIDFDSRWAERSVDAVRYEDPSAAEYAGKAKQGGVWDLKSKTPNGNAYFGSLLYGKYVSARDAGNFLAGVVAQSSNIPNFIIDFGYGVYNKSNNSIFKSIFIAIGNIAQGPTAIAQTAMYGEDQLSRIGIEAGKAFMKKKPMW